MSQYTVTNTTNVATLTVKNLRRQTITISGRRLEPGANAIFAELTSDILGALLAGTVSVFDTADGNLREVTVDTLAASGQEIRPGTTVQMVYGPSGESRQQIPYYDLVSAETPKGVARVKAQDFKEDEDGDLVPTNLDLTQPVATFEVEVDPDDLEDTEDGEEEELNEEEIEEAAEQRVAEDLEVARLDSESESGDFVQSGALKASEAVEYIEAASKEELDGFLSDDESRKTVLDAFKKATK